MFMGYTCSKIREQSKCLVTLYMVPARKGLASVEL